MPQGVPTEPPPCRPDSYDGSVHGPEHGKFCDLPIPDVPGPRWTCAGACRPAIRDYGQWPAEGSAPEPLPLLLSLLLHHLVASAVPNNFCVTGFPISTSLLCCCCCQCRRIMRPVRFGLYDRALERQSSFRRLQRFLCGLGADLTYVCASTLWAALGCNPQWPASSRCKPGGRMKPRRQDAPCCALRPWSAWVWKCGGPLLTVAARAFWPYLSCRVVGVEGLDRHCHCRVCGFALGPPWTHRKRTEAYRALAAPGARVCAWTCPTCALAWPLGRALVHLVP